MASWQQHRAEKTFFTQLSLSIGKITIVLNLALPMSISSADTKSLVQSNGG